MGANYFIKKSVRIRNIFAFLQKLYRFLQKLCRNYKNTVLTTRTEKDKFKTQENLLSIFYHFQIQMSRKEGEKTLPFHHELVVAEIAWLDEMTGESAGYQIPIRYHRSRTRLGQYSKTALDEFFSFSQELFDDTRATADILRCVVRHEYAHFIALKRFGCGGHSGVFNRIAELLDCAPSPALMEQLRKLLST